MLYCRYSPCRIVPYNTRYERNELSERLKQQLCVKELGLEAKEVDVYITTTTNTV